MFINVYIVIIVVIIVNIVYYINIDVSIRYIGYRVIGVYIVVEVVGFF